MVFIRSEGHPASTHPSSVTKLRSSCIHLPPSVSKSRSSCIHLPPVFRSQGHPASTCPECFEVKVILRPPVPSISKSKSFCVYLPYGGRVLYIISLVLIHWYYLYCFLISDSRTSYQLNINYFRDRY